MPHLAGALAAPEVHHAFLKALGDVEPVVVEPIELHHAVDLGGGTPPQLRPALARLRPEPHPSPDRELKADIAPDEAVVEPYEEPSRANPDLSRPGRSLTSYSIENPWAEPKNGWPI